MRLTMRSLLVVVLGLSLSACDGNDDDDPYDSEAPAAAPAEAEVPIDVDPIVLRTNFPNPTDWQSSDPGVATVTDGVVESVATGTVEISVAGAAIPDRVVSEIVFVDPPLLRVIVSPPAGQVPPGIDIDLSAIAIFEGGYAYPVTERATWSVDVDTRATVNGTTIQTVAGDPGLVTVTADFKGVQGTTPLFVGNIVPDALDVLFDAGTLRVGTVDRVAALPTSGGNPVGFPGRVTWASSDESVLVVDEDGNVTGVGAGTATVTGTDSASRSDTIDVSVIQAVPDSTVISLGAPITGSFQELPVGPPGFNFQFQLIGVFGTDRVQLSDVTWRTSTPNARIVQSGVDAGTVFTIPSIAETVTVEAETPLVETTTTGFSSGLEAVDAAQHNVDGTFTPVTSCFGGGGYTTPLTIDIVPPIAVFSQFNTNDFNIGWVNRFNDVFALRVDYGEMYAGTLEPGGSGTLQSAYRNPGGCIDVYDVVLAPQ